MLWGIMLKVMITNVAQIYINMYSFFFQVFTGNMEQFASPWYSDSRFAPFWQQYNALMSTAHHNAVSRAGHVASQVRGALSTLVSTCHITTVLLSCLLYLL